MLVLMNVLAIYLEFAKLSERNFEVGFPKEMSVPSKVHLFFMFIAFEGLFTASR